MNCIRFTGFRSGALACVLAGFLLAIGPLLAVSAAAPEVSAEARQVQEKFDAMGRYFEAHPELKTTPGSGWKPYNRSKWFHEQRMHEGELPPAGARWAAWSPSDTRTP